MPGFDACPNYGIDENFAAVILSGGRLVALGRGSGTVHVTVASNWKDPSTYIAPTGWRIDDANGSWWGEDPFVWVDAKGRFHSLSHAGDGSHLAEHPDPDWGCGRHWFSENGTRWHHAPLRYGGCAYNPSTNFSDGSSYRFGRSERPHLMFGPDGTTPIALVVAVTAENVSWGSGGAHDASHTFLQPIRTKTDDVIDVITNEIAPSAAPHLSCPSSRRRQQAAAAAAETRRRTPSSRQRGGWWRPKARPRTAVMTLCSTPRPAPPPGRAVGIGTGAPLVDSAAECERLPLFARQSTGLRQAG